MKVVKHSEGIYEVENFLNDQEMSLLLSYVDVDEFKESHPGNIVQDLPADSLSIVEGISNRMINLFDNHKSYTPIRNIRRIGAGESMPLHKDDGDKYTKNRIIFGTVIYLNENFSGGELNYPDLDISIKPKEGSIMIHDSQISHQVLSVMSGDRYSLTSFIFGDNNTVFNF